MTIETKKYLVRSVIVILVLAAIYIFFKWNDTNVYEYAYQKGFDEGYSQCKTDYLK